MQPRHKITLEIPDEIFNEIREFRKRTKISNEESAIFELIKYALSLPSYFRNFDWKEAEEEADKDIKSGNIKSFSSGDEFLSDLKA